MDFNGVVLISSVLDFETLNFAAGHDISYVLYLPSYAAVAAYHHLIPTPANLPAFLDTVRQFAAGPYAAALEQGSSLGAAERASVLQRLSAYTGLDTTYLGKAELRVTLGQFLAQLQRARGLVTGRIDARFSGPEQDLLGEYAPYDPQGTAITGAFTAAINLYLRDELKWPGTERYNVMSGLHWDWKREGRGGGWTSATYVGGDLASALTRNVNLRVQVENGYDDLATPFFATEWTMNHLDLRPDLRGHIELKYYDAGHMMYLHVPALEQLKGHIAQFIGATDNVSR
jgi:carboxypeptidase C (cathepsin A)